MNRGDVATLAVIVAVLIVATWRVDWFDTRRIYSDLRRDGRSRWMAGGVALALLVSAFLFWFL